MTTTIQGISAVKSDEELKVKALDIPDALVTQKEMIKGLSPKKKLGKNRPFSAESKSLRRSPKSALSRRLQKHSLNSRSSLKQEVKKKSSSKIVFSIPTFEEIIKGKKSHTVYRIHLASRRGDQKDTLVNIKRYRQFLEFDATVKEQYPNLKIELPSKTLIKPRTNEEKVARSKALEKYLNNLAASEIREVIVLLEDFLEIREYGTPFDIAPTLGRMASKTLPCARTPPSKLINKHLHQFAHTSSMPKSKSLMDIGQKKSLKLERKNKQYVCRFNFETGDTVCIHCTGTMTFGVLKDKLWIKKGLSEDKNDYVVSLWDSGAVLDDSGEFSLIFSIIPDVRKLEFVDLTISRKNDDKQKLNSLGDFREGLKKMASTFRKGSSSGYFSEDTGLEEVIPDSHQYIFGISEKRMWGAEYNYGFPCSPHDTKRKAWVEKYEKVQHSRMQTWHKVIGPAFKQEHPGIWLYNNSKEVYQSVTKNKSLCRKGIPAGLRSYIWEISCRAKDERYKNVRYYQNITEDLPQLSEELLMEINNTFSDHSFYKADEGKSSLRRIMKAIIYRHPTLVHHRPLNLIAAVLLLVCKEDVGFWMIDTIVTKIMPDNYFTNSLIGVRTNVRFFSLLVRDRLPAVSKHLKRLDIQLEPIVLKWFMSIFVVVFPVETVLRVWDVFFVEGSDVLLSVALALLEMKSNILVLQSTTHKFNKFMDNIGTDLFDCDKLIEVAMGHHSPSSFASFSDRHRPQILLMMTHQHGERKSRNELQTKKAVSHDNFTRSSDSESFGPNSNTGIWADDFSAFDDESLTEIGVMPTSTSSSSTTTTTTTAITITSPLTTLHHHHYHHHHHHHHHYHHHNQQQLVTITTTTTATTLIVKTEKTVETAKTVKTTVRTTTTTTTATKKIPTSELNKATEATNADGTLNVAVQGCFK